MQISYFDEMLEQCRYFIDMYVEFEVEAKEGKDAFNKQIRGEKNENISKVFQK